MSTNYTAFFHQKRVTQKYNENVFIRFMKKVFSSQSRF